MLPVTFVGSLYRPMPYCVKKITDVHGIEVRDVWT